MTTFTVWKLVDSGRWDSPHVRPFSTIAAMMLTIGYQARVRETDDGFVHLEVEVLA